MEENTCWVAVVDALLPPQLTNTSTSVCRSGISVRFQERLRQDALQSPRPGGTRSVSQNIWLGGRAPLSLNLNNRIDPFASAHIHITRLPFLTHATRKEKSHPSIRAHTRPFRSTQGNTTSHCVVWVQYTLRERIGYVQSVAPHCNKRLRVGTSLQTGTCTTGTSSTIRLGARGSTARPPLITGRGTATPGAGRPIGATARERCDGPTAADTK